MTERAQRIADAARLYIDVYDADIAYLDALNSEYQKLSSLLEAAQG